MHKLKETVDAINIYGSGTTAASKAVGFSKVGQEIDRLP